MDISDFYALTTVQHYHVTFSINAIERLHISSEGVGQLLPAAEQKLHQEKITHPAMQSDYKILFVGNESHMYIYEIL